MNSPRAFYFTPFRSVFCAKIELPDYIDHTSRKISLTTNPSRIISIVPSLTELLSDLSLDTHVVGITKYCVHPAGWQSKKEIIGGTKNLDIQRIHLLRPDLILASKEENIKEQIEELAGFCPVWVSDIHNFAESLSAIVEIGRLTGQVDRATRLATSIEQEFSLLKTPTKKPTVIYLIWRKPYMTTGGDTFIHAMLAMAGFENVYKQHLRYPLITIDEIKRHKPDYLFLSSEPFPFTDKHVHEIKQQLPEINIVLVDGEMFSWYGSRMQYAPSYFLKLWQYGLHGK